MRSGLILAVGMAIYFVTTFRGFWNFLSQIPCVSMQAPAPAQVCIFWRDTSVIVASDSVCVGFMFAGWSYLSLVACALLGHLIFQVSA